MDPSARMGAYRFDPGTARPVSGQGEAASGGGRSLMHYWFVEYNPLYFFSALCVLAGVLLVSCGLAEIGWKRGQLILALVTQLYELLLIAGAALLFRVARQKRPAVILGLMEVVFLFDWTFRTESLGTIAHGGSAVTLLWTAMVPVKLLLLCRIFRLRVRLPLVLLPSLAAAGIAAAPHLLVSADMRGEAIHLALTWFGAACAAAAALLRPELESDASLSGWERAVMRRAGSAAWAIWGALYGVHLVACAAAFGIPLGLAHLVPFLLLFALLVRRRGEAWVWSGCAAAVFIGMSEPPTTAPTALAATVVLGVAGWQTRRYRLLVGAVLALRLAALTAGWQDGPLPDPTLVGTLITAAVLVGLGVVLGLPSAFATAALICLPVAKRFVPRNSLEWGTSLLAVGFIALVVGVAINWDRRHSPGDCPGG